MKVTVEGEVGLDFPNIKRITFDKAHGSPDPKFIEELKKSVAKRLELRPKDIVVIVIKDGTTTYTFKDKE